MQGCHTHPTHNDHLQANCKYSVTAFRATILMQGLSLSFDNTITKAPKMPYTFTACTRIPELCALFAVCTVLLSIHVTQNYDPQLLYSVLLGELLQACHIVLSNSITLTHMHSKLVVISLLITTPSDIPPYMLTAVPATLKKSTHPVPCSI